MPQSATASNATRSIHLSERSPWDFLTTLLAPAAAQRPTPVRRKRARHAAASGEEGAAACGWFDSSQDLMQGLSVVESFGGQRLGPKPAARSGPWVNWQAAQQALPEEGIIAA